MGRRVGLMRSLSLPGRRLIENEEYKKGRSCSCGKGVRAGTNRTIDGNCCFMKTNIIIGDPP